MTSPGGHERAGVAGSLAGEVTETGVFGAVLDGYDAVYDALPRGETFSRLWRAHAYRGDFPEQFAHIGFLTVPEAQRMRELLQIRPGDVLADLACGAGGPGLWMAAQSGASLTGVDPSPAGLAAARARAREAGLAGRARFCQGTFEQTSLPDGAADAVMSVEAFQYAPDKRAAVTEFFRVLRRGGGWRSSRSRSIPPKSQACRSSVPTRSRTTGRSWRQPASRSRRTRKHPAGGSASTRPSAPSPAPATPLPRRWESTPPRAR